MAENTSSLNLSEKKSKSLKRIFGGLVGIIVIAVVYFWLRDPIHIPPPPPPPPPPIQGFVALVPPISDSLPIGKTFIEGGLSGKPSKKFSAYRSWETLVKNGTVNDTAAVNSNIKNILNTALGGEKNGVEVVNVSGIIYYSSNDYSYLDLPDSGVIVVAAAVAAREFSFKTASSVSKNAAFTAIKKYLPDAQFSGNGDVTLAASGTGLVVGVKLLKVTKHEIDTTTFTIKTPSFQYLDPFKKQYNYISFSNTIKTSYWQSLDLKFSASHIKLDGSSQIASLVFCPSDNELLVTGIKNNPVVSIAPDLPNLKMPVRLIGSQIGSQVYLYQIVENYCTYQYNYTGAIKPVPNWKNVKFKGLDGSFRITSERWSFEMTDKP